MSQSQRRELPWKELAHHAGLHRLPATREMLTLVPGIAAGAVALLYTVGALLWVAELQGIPVSVADALPLVPLEQILSRGIGTLVVIGLVAALGAPLIVAAPWIDARLEAKITARVQAQDSRARTRLRRKLLMSRWALLGLLVAIAVTLPPIIAIAVVLIMSASSTPCHGSDRQPSEP